MTGQMHTALNRFYAKKKTEKLTQSALFLSSESDNVYLSAIYEYEAGMIGFMGLKHEGIIAAYGKNNKSEKLLNNLYTLGHSLEKYVEETGDDQ